MLVSVGNRAADFAALLGTWRAGAVAVPVHSTTPGRVLESLREATGVRLVLDGATGEAARVADRPPPGRALLDGAALVIFTSGSTGAPKGVVIGHGRLAGKLDVLRSVLGIAHGPHTLLPLQVTFIFGIWVSLVTVLAGGRLTMMPKFTPAEARAALGSGVTTAAFVPTMLRALFSEAAPPPAAPDLTRILTGGEPLGRAWAPGLPGPSRRPTCTTCTGSPRPDPAISASRRNCGQRLPARSGCLLPEWRSGSPSRPTPVRAAPGNC